MSAFPHLPLFTDAFIADTMHLNAQETGAYLMLMMVAWRTKGCQIQDDDDTLCKFARLDRRTWLRIKPKVMSFWTFSDGYWSQKRLSKEREYVSKRAEVNRENGKQGGRPKSLTNNEAANPVGSSRVSEKNPPIPIPIPIPIQKDNPQDPIGSSAPKGAKRPERGSFLDRDWKPSEADWAFAKSELGDDLSVAREREKFRNYWFSKSGADGRKRDWSATWRNWIMRAAENGKRSSDLFPGSPSRSGPSRSPVAAVGSAMARFTDQGSFGSREGADHPRREDRRDYRTGCDDPEIADADWSPARGYRAAH